MAREEKKARCGFQSWDIPYVGRTRLVWFFRSRKQHEQQHQQQQNTQTKQNITKHAFSHCPPDFLPSRTSWLWLVGGKGVTGWWWWKLEERWKQALFRSRWTLVVGLWRSPDDCKMSEVSRRLLKTSPTGGVCASVHVPERVQSEHSSSVAVIGR